MCMHLSHVASFDNEKECPVGSWKISALCEYCWHEIFISEAKRNSRGPMIKFKLLTVYGAILQQIRSSYGRGVWLCFFCWPTSVWITAQVGCRSAEVHLQSLQSCSVWILPGAEPALCLLAWEWLECISTHESSQSSVQAHPSARRMEGQGVEAHEQAWHELVQTGCNYSHSHCSISVILRSS